jgi:hypothetical protein
MRFSRLTALLAIVLALAVAGCSGGVRALLGPEYEYEEDLTLALDGSATIIVNTSLPALAALRGLDVAADANTPSDQIRSQIDHLYSSPYASVVRVSQWTRHGRRFVGIRLSVPDIRRLSKSAPFAWEHFELKTDGDEVTYRDALGPSAFKRGTLSNVGWQGNELVAFRLHLPSRIRYHNSRDLHTNQPLSPSRGNILTWEQMLTDRLDDGPIGYANDHTPGVMEVRMDRESILYRTLWLFASAFIAAVVLLAFMIWLAVRKGRRVTSDRQGPASAGPLPRA